MHRFYLLHQCRPAARSGRVTCRGVVKSHDRAAGDIGRVFAQRSRAENAARCQETAPALAGPATGR